MNSLDFIKKHVKEWPEGCWMVRLDKDGEIVFSDTGSASSPNFYPTGFTSDIYDGTIWTCSEFEAHGITSSESPDDEWVDEVVCYADGKQWFFLDNHLLTDHEENLATYEEVLQYTDFQLNDIVEGDYLSKEYLYTEKRYKEAVKAFGMFGFSREGAYALSYKYFIAHPNESALGCSEGLLIGMKYSEREITYNQLMAISKLKIMMDERKSTEQKLENVWSPTINSIVDVGDCEGVVKAIVGEHYWVLKDTGMYDTYHKDSLKKPLSDEEKLHKEVVAAVSDAAWITNCEAKTVVGKLNKLGYKIVCKEDSE